MRTLILKLLPAGLLVSFFACRDTPTESSNPDIQLALENVGVTDAWLHIKLAESVPLRVLTLQRDGHTILTIQNSPVDTSIYIESMIPNHRYLYEATLPLSEVGLSERSSLIITTMDTTSHSFTWESDTLGDGNSSNLLDVCFVKDSLAFAVGEIYLKDSTGNFDPIPYNLAKWNGITWSLDRIVVSYHGNQVVVPLNAIKVFSENDIWVTGGLPIHGDGTTWTLYHLYDLGVLAPTDGDVDRVWGVSSSDIFFGGPKGSMVHYDGISWKKLESGTSLDMQDIYGGQIMPSGKFEILAVASQPFDNPDRALLRLSPQAVMRLSDGPIHFSLSGVWFVPSQAYYVVGSGIYKKSRLTDSTWRNGRTDITPYYLNAIRGTDANNIVAVGAFGEIVHFNGLSWRSYLSSTYLSSGTLHGVAIRGRVLIAVGEVVPRALIIRGERIM